MPIALSHSGTTMYQSSTPSDEVLAGTTEGIVILQHDGRGGWKEAGRALEGMHIHALVFEPGSGIWFAGVYRNGVFASADQGRTWESRSNGIDPLSVFSLAVANREAGVRLYAGTEPARLFYSDDLGRNWTLLPALESPPSRHEWRFAADPFDAHVKQISIDPFDPETLYVSVEVGGLHKSIDGGMTFEELATPHMDVHRTVPDPRTPGKIFMVNGGAGLFVSENGGQSWEQLTDKQHQMGSYPDLLAYAPSNPDRMFICASVHGPRSWVEEGLPANGGVSRSMDDGRTWEVCMDGLAGRLHGSIEAMCLEQANDAISLFAADTDGTVIWSPDAGNTWRVIAQTPPVAKSVHAEMMAGGGPTPLKFSDGSIVVNGVRV